MKRIALLLSMLFLCGVAHGQQNKVLSAASSDCSVANSCLVYGIDPTSGGATFTVSANAGGNTLQFEGTGNGTLWVQLNATPSNSSTATSSTTSTGTWQVNVAAYITIRIRMSTQASGNSTVSIITSTASARAGGGGGGGGGVTAVTGSGPIASSGGTTPAISCPTCNVSGATIAGSIAAGNTAYGSAANTIAGGTVVLDMAGIAGADLGAKMNNCAALLPASGGTCKGDNLTGALTLSTAVTTAVPVSYTFSGQTITQTANINLANTLSGIDACSGTPATITKGANIDQVTISSTQNFVRCINFAGAKASFTGNAIAVAVTASQAEISGNIISGEANDDIKDAGNTFGANKIHDNWLFSWGLHAFESTASSSQCNFSDNFALGDGTATGATVANGGGCTITNNFLKDSNGVVTLDDSVAAQINGVVGNHLYQTAGWPGLKTSGLTMATGNTVNAGGANGPGVSALGGTVTSNTVSVINGDGIDAGNGTTVGDNIINLNLSGVSGKCAVNALGDIIGTRVHHNEIVISDNMADTNAGDCDTPSGTHNLGIVFDGDHVATTLTGGAVVYGFFMNNAAGVNTNWSATVENIGCVHLMDCLKRTDAQNNTTIYRDIQNEDTTFDAGTGSTNDVFFQSQGITFSNLPSPAGAGSWVLCTNCQPLSITAASGGPGALVTRQQTLVGGISSTNWTGNQAVVGQDNHTAEITGNYAALILIPSTAPTGSYVVTINVLVSTSVATSTIVASIAYADVTGAQTQNGVLVSGATAGTQQSLTFSVPFVTGTALTYSTTTANSPKYKLIARAITQ